MAAKKKTTKTETAQVETAPAVTVQTAQKALKPVETAVETAVAAAQESVETAVQAGKQNLDTAVKAGTEAASKGYDQVVAKTKEQVGQAVALTKENVDKASTAAFKGYDEFALVGKDNLDALVRTNGIVAKGMEVFGQEMLSYAQASLANGMAQTKALLAAKNLKEVVELHNDFAREHLDKVIAETAKLTELSVQVTNEAIEPLQKRVDVTVETLLKAQAA